MFTSAGRDAVQADVGRTRAERAPGGLTQSQIGVT